MNHKFGKKQQLFIKLALSPLAKISAPLIIQALSGVLAGVFIFDITKENHLVWTDSYKHWSFWLMLFLLMVNIWYFRQIKEAESNIDRFSDEDYCRAYMNHLCLPALAETVAEQIRAGNVNAYSEGMDIIRRRQS